MTESTVERGIRGSKLRNGNVIRTFYPFMDHNGREQKLVRDMWIRGRNQEPTFLQRKLKLEIGNSGTFISVSVMDIFEGRVDGLQVEGVYTPEELNLIDPRTLNPRVR